MNSHKWKRNCITIPLVGRVKMTKNLKKLNYMKTYSLKVEGKTQHEKWPVRLSGYALLMSLQPILTEISLQMTWPVRLIHDSLSTDRRIGEDNVGGTITREHNFITNLTASQGHMASRIVTSKHLRTTTKILWCKNCSTDTQGIPPFRNYLLHMSTLMLIAAFHIP